MSDSTPRAATTVVGGVNSVQISNGPGALRTVTVTGGTISAIGSFYDYIQGSGALPAPLFTIPSNATIGQVYTLNFPVNNGIWYVGINGSPGITVGWD